MPPISGKNSSISGQQAAGPAPRPASARARPRAAGAGPGGLRRALRADARRNRAQLLLAARDVFVEHGADAPLDEVARRAGVGIATLYRRFPDRESLLRGVALDVLGRAAHEACRALAEEPNACQALARYMHRALDLRISAVMPTLLGRISFEDAEVSQARDQAVQPLLRLIEGAQSDGSLRADVAFGDIGPLLVRLSRPLPGPIPRDLDRRLAHRALDLVLAGMRAGAESATAPLGGPALTLDDLRRAASTDPDP